MKKNTELEVKKQDLQPVQGSAEALISQAISNNVPVESLERLLVMRRELKAEQAKESFDRALAKFQAECPTIQKRKKVAFGTTNYSYAPLEDIVEQVKDNLSDNGFSYTFDTKQTENAMKIFCKVSHIDGHSEVSEFEIQIDNGSKMNVSQRYGSASSYGKRYAFCNALGILTGDEDNDAHVPEKPSQSKNGHTISYQQQKKIFALLSEKGISKDELDGNINTYFKKTSIRELTTDEANKIIASLEKAEVRQEIDMDEVDEALSKSAS